MKLLVFRMSSTSFYKWRAKFGGMDAFLIVGNWVFRVRGLGLPI